MSTQQEIGIEAKRILSQAWGRRPRSSELHISLAELHDQIDQEIDAGEASAEAAVCVVLEANAISYRFDHPEGAPDVLVIED